MVGHHCNIRVGHHCTIMVGHHCTIVVEHCSDNGAPLHTHGGAPLNHEGRADFKRCGAGCGLLGLHCIRWQLWWSGMNDAGACGASGKCSTIGAWSGGSRRGASRISALYLPTLSVSFLKDSPSTTFFTPLHTGTVLHRYYDSLPGGQCICNWTIKLEI